MPIVETHWSTLVQRPVSIEVGDIQLKGDLVVPEDPFGMVLFGAGTGMSRTSSRAKRISRELQEQGLATLTLDLVTPQEEMRRFGNENSAADISVLAERLAGATAWAKRQPQLRDFPIGYFGAASGAAAALEAAAGQRGLVDALVCWNGKVDPAAGMLGRVPAPTLLLVGDGDFALAQTNESALFRLGASRKELIMIPGASSRFAEAGDLDVVADLTADWFSRYLILVS